MSKVLCLGEIVVDWVRTTNGAAPRRLFAPPPKTRAEGFFAEPGTPAANVALALARLGVSSGLIACVGNDEMGSWLKHCLDNEGVDSQGVVVHPSAITCQAFAAVEKDGERHLVKISEGACADTQLHPAAVSAAQFNGADVLYVGSNSLSSNPIGGATKHALTMARKRGMLVVADANIRVHLWKSQAECKEQVLTHLAGVDVLKVNLDEFELLTGSRDVRKANALRLSMNVPVLLVTLGAMGSFYATPNGAGFVPAAVAEVADSSGAGDAFTAAVIAQLVERLSSSRRREELASISAADWSRILQRANTAGALTVSRVGAASALPTKTELDDFAAQAVKAV